MARKAARRATRRALRWRRVRALLAGGAVLGVGASATLAAWNDVEHGSATFTAGTFGIVGSTDGEGFAEHATADAPAMLNFQVAPTAMTPGATTYALFSVRTTASSVAGTVELAADAANGAGLGQYLTYGVRTVSSTTCDAAAFAGSSSDVVASGSVLTTGGAGARSLDAGGGSTVHYCFAVTLRADAPNAAQGAAVSPAWQFTATAS
ncbi:SipW-dependent-type signal peptide-containing protein [Microbacterium betulae]|uniref:SipW-dependent-type signal peptide-containing protein n=1 Tax=Microbacterium betulae TaxID=2981139 RepID=A0AA97FJ70_9MICO|nr:SipW-dependent-type signal peptide-containing protein [Microbacterium sp. AB]WOF23718.1 SipW-dependent-type signal peptide-containing protein [Microbacterium sp. AB]